MDYVPQIGDVMSIPAGLGQHALDSMPKLGMWPSGMVDIGYQTMFKKIPEAILLQPMMFHMQIY